MRAHKLMRAPWCMAAWWAVLSAGPPVAVCADELAEPAMPGVAEAHRAFLSRIARRTVRDRALGRPKYEPAYIPDELSAVEAEVLVRLRQRGYLRGLAAAGPGPVAMTTRDAALGAAEMLAGSPDADVNLVNDLLIEIEVVGPPQAIPVEGDWTRPRAVDAFVEPGVHGVVLLGSRVQHRFTPTELYTNDLVLAQALERLAQQSHATPNDIADVRVMRFRTAHWYEAASDTIVSLHRGMTVLPEDFVTPRTLDEAIGRIGEYMIYRQRTSGLFTYQYEPGADRYSEEQNAVRQVGAVSAMALFARRTGRSAARTSCDRGIEFHLQGLTPLAGTDDAAFIATADGENKLGVTALLGLTMAEHPQPGLYAETRRKLVKGMLALQMPSGMFVTAFPPAVQIRAQEYFPGEALLALAHHYQLDPSGEILDAFHRGLEFYREFFRDRPSPAFVPWQVQAYAAMARQSHRDDYVAYVFELTDWLIAHQLTRENCAWPDLWGGVAAYSDGRAGVSTAAYLEGFADALLLARAVGDTPRAERYEKVVREAARFVMQLQVRPEEAYYMRSPQDAVGAIRTSPSLNLLRIDHCQHALVGLIKARNALFPTSD